MPNDHFSKQLHNQPIYHQARHLFIMGGFRLNSRGVPVVDINSFGQIPDLGEWEAAPLPKTWWNEARQRARDFLYRVTPLCHISSAMVLACLDESDILRLAEAAGSQSYIKFLLNSNDSYRRISFAKPGELVTWIAQLYWNWQAASYDSAVISGPYFGQFYTPYHGSENYLSVQITNVALFDPLSDQIQGSGWEQVEETSRFCFTNGVVLLMNRFRSLTSHRLPEIRLLYIDEKTVPTATKGIRFEIRGGSRRIMHAFTRRTPICIWENQSQNIFLDLNQSMVFLVTAKGAHGAQRPGGPAGLLYPSGAAKWEPLQRLYMGQVSVRIFDDHR